MRRTILNGQTIKKKIWQRNCVCMGFYSRIQRKNWKNSKNGFFSGFSDCRKKIDRFWIKKATTKIFWLKFQFWEINMVQVTRRVVEICAIWCWMYVIFVLILFDRIQSKVIKKLEFKKKCKNFAQHSSRKLKFASFAMFSFKFFPSVAMEKFLLKAISI